MIALKRGRLALWPAGSPPGRQVLPVDAVEQFGPEAALTGPVIRGDVQTLRSHLFNLIRPGLAELYRSLAVATLELADRAGRLDPESRAALSEELSTWRRSLEEEPGQWS